MHPNETFNKLFKFVVKINALFKNVWTKILSIAKSSKFQHHYDSMFKEWPVVLLNLEIYNPLKQVVINRNERCLVNTFAQDVLPYGPHFSILPFTAAQFIIYKTRKFGWNLVIVNKVPVNE